MSDLTPQAIISHMKDDARNGPLAKPLMIARIIAITAAVAGAVPTAVNFYHSWAHGIPYNEVSHRLSQYDLWVKNFECKIDYRALTTQAGTRVDVGSCPKSGDIAIKVSAANGNFYTADFSQHQLARMAGYFRNRKARKLCVGNICGILNRIDNRAKCRAKDDGVFGLG